MPATSMSEAPRLIYNNDGSFLLQTAPPMSPDEFVYEAVGRVIGTQVGRVICNLFGLGDALPWYKTEIPEARPPRNTTYTNLQEYRVQENLHHLWSLDVDVWEMAVQAAHDAGMEFWPGTRFNDRHGERFAWLTEWRTRHPEYNIPKDCTEGRYGVAGGPRGLNYALPEVRAWKIRLMEEVCTRYDVDGFELDLMREPMVSFTDIEAGRPILTEFLADCRAALDRIGEKRGRPLGFGIRTAATPEATHEMGLDLEAVLEQRSVTCISPSVYWDTATDAPFDRFVEMARGKDCHVYACPSEQIGPGPQYVPASKEALRGAACNAWHQGVDGIYIFNFNHNPTCNVDGAELLGQLGHPETLRYRDKRYAVTGIAELIERYDTGVVERGYMESYHRSGSNYSSFEHQLPVSLEETPTGPGRIIDLLVHEDLTTAAERGMLKSVILEITVAGSTKDDAFEFRLNGHRLPDPESPEFHLYSQYRMGPRWNGMQGNYAVRYNLGAGEPLVQGRNEVALTLRRRNPKISCDFVIHDIFLDVTFHNLTMRG